MRFYLYHPDYPQTGFYIPFFSAEVEEHVNRLSPVKLVSGAYDWPDKTFSYHGWTDTINSLWWPEGANEFSSVVLLLDDFRNDLINQSIQYQIAATPAGTWRIPYLILSARLSPPYGGRPGESFAPVGLPPVYSETVFLEWLLYPLPPVNISSLDPTNRFRGLWLLPLVDIRYFLRNVPLNSFISGSSSGSLGELAYPLVNVDRTEANPSWMPPVRGYPQDLFVPPNFTQISGNGIHPAVNGSMHWGEAVSRQSRMQGWRVVCRDVRTAYNVAPGNLPHVNFTGVVADYPEDWSLGAALTSYHLDAVALLSTKQSRRAGGVSDVRSLPAMTARKVQCLFQVENFTCFYSVTIQTTVDFPSTVLDLVEDVDGPDAGEKMVIPLAALGVQVTSRTPTAGEHAQLVDAAKLWALCYFSWRHSQGYWKYPGIFPVIPNGHAKVIRWDFSHKAFETTYVALEGDEGTEFGWEVMTGSGPTPPPIISPGVVLRVTSEAVNPDGYGARVQKWLPGLGFQDLNNIRVRVAARIGGIFFPTGSFYNGQLVVGTFLGTTSSSAVFPQEPNQDCYESIGIADYQTGGIVSPGNQTLGSGVKRVDYLGITGGAPTLSGVSSNPVLLHAVNVGSQGGAQGLAIILNVPDDADGIGIPDFGWNWFMGTLYANGYQCAAQIGFPFLQPPILIGRHQYNHLQWQGTVTVDNNIYRSGASLSTWEWAFSDIDSTGGFGSHLTMEVWNIAGRSSDNYVSADAFLIKTLRVQDSDLFGTHFYSGVTRFIQVSTPGGGSLTLNVKQGIIVGVTSP